MMNDPTWLDEIAKIIDPFASDFPTASDAREKARAVISFVTRQPREITPQSLNAVARIIADRFQLRENETLQIAYYALEAAEKARANQL